jgi:hypothetical protein
MGQAYHKSTTYSMAVVLIVGGPKLNPGPKSICQDPTPGTESISSNHLVVGWAAQVPVASQVG